MKLALVGALLIFAVIMILRSVKRDEHVEQYLIIHKRDKLCPPQWQLEPLAFGEPDGSRQDACINPDRNAPNDIDSLSLGETLGLHTDPKRLRREKRLGFP